MKICFHFHNLLAWNNRLRSNSVTSIIDNYSSQGVEAFKVNCVVNLDTLKVIFRRNKGCSITTEILQQIKTNVKKTKFGNLLQTPGLGQKQKLVAKAKFKKSMLKMYLPENYSSSKH